MQAAGVPSVKTLKPLLVGSTYVPVLFAIGVLATVDSCIEYGDKLGVTGGFTGVFCLSYASSISVSLSSQGSGVFRVLLAVRLGLGALALLSSIFMGIKGGKGALEFVFLYLIFGLLSIPEALLLYTYSTALEKEAVGPPCTPAPAPPPVAPAGPPHFAPQASMMMTTAHVTISAGDFGIGTAPQSTAQAPFFTGPAAAAAPVPVLGAYGSPQRAPDSMPMPQQGPHF
mmetsp:Transcript_3399/g.7813  ORF Transcript_3399/g.7813 Transcript_3399/m.7813 type:complete len:228 (+) Transcript_3399:108-791(+)